MTAQEEHKLLYPKQYDHPLVGKRVRNRSGKEFVVRRVVGSMFGKLAVGDDHREAWAVNTLTIIGG